MISFNKAKKIIFANTKPLAPKIVSLDMDCLNTVLAENIFSRENIPNYNNSAMDGYAVKSADTRRIPAVLKVTGEVRAGGHISKKIKTGEAVKIMTGAIIPAGADAVVMAENTKEKRPSRFTAGEAGGEEVGSGRVGSPQVKPVAKKWEVKILKPVRKGENIRCAGEDIKKGNLVLKKGGVLKAAGIGLLASIGKTKIKIIPKPKIAIISTGDEIVDASTKKLSKGKVRNSNIWTLSMLIKRDGGIPIPLGIIPDNLHKIKTAIKKAVAAADAVIISAGISVGEYDFVKTALQESDAKILFWKVAMKPGKPFAFSKVKGLKTKTVPIFSLPGNPVSTMVTYEELVRPAVAKMAGKKTGELPHATAILRHTIYKKLGRKEFIRGCFLKKGGKYFVNPTGSQGSGILKSMSEANCFIVLDEQTVSAKKGTPVNIEILNWGNEYGCD